MTKEFDLSIWLSSIIILIIVLYSLWRKKQNIPYLFFFAVFWIYLLFVLKVTLFPIPIENDSQITSSAMVFLSSMNFIPFYIPRYSRAILFNHLLNIYLTIPFGFGINFIKPTRKKAILWLSILVGVTIETLQLVVSLWIGFPYRVVDINDIIMNAVGVLLGYGFFQLFRLLFRRFIQKN